MCPLPLCLSLPPLSSWPRLLSLDKDSSSPALSLSFFLFFFSFSPILASCRGSRRLTPHALHRAVLLGQVPALVCSCSTCLPGLLAWPIVSTVPNFSSPFDHLDFLRRLIYRSAQPSARFSLSHSAVTTGHLRSPSSSQHRRSTHTFIPLTPFILPIFLYPPAGQPCSCAACSDGCLKPKPTASFLP